MRKKVPTMFRIASGANPGLLVLGILCIALLATAPAAHAAELPGLTVIGIAADGTTTPVTDYRWLVEEDKTYHVPVDTRGAATGAFDPLWDQGNDAHVGGETLAVSFHESYMPVVAKGCVNMPAAAACNELPFADDGQSRYYVSVMPRSGYSIGGASYDPVSGATVYVNQHPIPTAQISILVFHDNAPINNAPDLPGEDPANPGATDMSGFQIIVEDAGGRWGASAGIQSQDAFGNPLGTTYLGGCDAAGNPDNNNTTDFVCLDGEGNPIANGYAPLITDSTGRLTIKNLAPGKYGIQAVPPAGGGWQQTSTIEGTRIIDAWVKANEPPFFAEFGPPGFHAFIGFVKDFNEIPTGGGATIEGAVVNNHLSRPPDYAFYAGGCFGHTTPWVGLNDMSAGIGNGIYAAPTDENCSFSIPDVPDGNYQLVFWDNNLDVVFAFKGISIVGGECQTPTGCNVGLVPVFQWFHRQEHFVYDDYNANGLFDPAEGETPILEQAFLLRWRDGTVYQENVSDPAGLFAFDQVFPFFSWLVTEVDFARFQAASLTVVADNGGPIPFGSFELGIGPENDPTFGGMINPQDQTNPTDGDCIDPAVCLENDVYRTDFGPILTAGFQGFLGQTHAFQWGKRHYADGENGGISGIVFYAITRAEDDPAKAAAEPWEPGIPGVEVNLYESLVDPGTGEVLAGDLLNTTTTDSWDDSIPTGCKDGNGGTPFSWSPDGTTMYETDCYDGLRVFNQVRPAVFDGGYAFNDYYPGGITVNESGDVVPNVSGEVPVTLIPGNYIVEVIPPPGYEILKPEDKNVDFGDVFEAKTMKAAQLPIFPECVGDPALIPPYLTLFPDEQVPSPFAWETGVYEPTYRALCDRKEVVLTAGANAAADFWLFTEVPVAAHGFGFILDDTQNEFDPNSPQFGEKYAPPFVPVTVRDWTGRVISKTISDQYGRYNFLAPSTITTNLPAPSGMSPNMLTTCMNDPGEDAANPDPNHNELYSTFCYTFQYMPGVTTYLDTPVVPVGAFTGPDQFPVDCEFPDGTPRIWDVDGDGFGPYLASAAGTLTVVSMGPTSVQNPNYCNAAAGPCPAGTEFENKFVIRDYGFGTTQGTGQVFIGDTELTVTAWDDMTITATVPSDATTGQLRVVRDNGAETVKSVTVQIGLRQGADVVRVNPADSIQDAIDAGGANDLILVDCGAYSEMVVMWKPVQLQGSGECTEINAVNAPFEKLEAWRGLVDGLVSGGDVNLLPGQETGGGPPEPLTLQTEEGAGVLVLARSGGPNSFDRDRNQGARIDGLTIRSASTGGGIIVNGYAHYLDISNNRVANNQGFYGGGIRVGHPELTNEDLCADGVGLCYTDADNDYVDIRHNQVVFNGGLGGAGGGISMCTGSDSYAVTENWVCGNFSLRDGGGIAHIGVSDGWWDTVPNSGPQGQRIWTLIDPPRIEDNWVIFNENFFQGQTVNGGGIFVGGTQPLTVGDLTDGAGNLKINRNLIQGNSAGAGDGGGIRLAAINGQDVAANPDNSPRRNGNAGRNDPAPWYGVDIFNNMIVNNVAALAGGGISLQDAVDVRIAHNTIANNDSLATAGEAFEPGNANQSVPQPGAGMVTRAHSTPLATAGSVGAFSDPSEFANNIIWQNRQFFFRIEEGAPGDPAAPGIWGLCPDIGGAITGLTCPGGNAPVYDDLAVIGAAGTLACDPGSSCILSGGADPLFVAEYVNGDRSSIFQPEINTGIQAPPAFDEGGNFIRAKYGPLSLFNDATANDGNPGVLFGDYHIQSGSPAEDNVNAIDLSSIIDLMLDFDMESRPSGTGADIGADEVQ